MKVASWVFRWLVGSFLMAVFAGSITWFIGSIFGAEWGYFSWLRGWFIAMLIVDVLLDLYMYGNREW